MNISRRPASAEDYDFLWNLHKKTMKCYVDEIWGWDEDFQKEYFDNRFCPDNIEIIKINILSIGAVEVRNEKSELYIMNLKIDTEFQRKEIGSAILREIIKIADSKNKPLKLQVLKINPAKLLYKRFNFKVVGETEIHFLMSRHIP